MPQLSLRDATTTVFASHAMRQTTVFASHAMLQLLSLLPCDAPAAVAAGQIPDRQDRHALIAVNYPARSFGIHRMCTVKEARRLCPNLIIQHVATWREGEDRWAYHDDAAGHRASDKVSLDLYRRESRRILAVIRATLPPGLQRIEKAGIDEVFLDLSAHVHAVLLERFPELTRTTPLDDRAENLPHPSTLGLVDLTSVRSAPDVPPVDSGELVPVDSDAADPDTASPNAAEPDDLDWADVAMLVAADIVRGVRAAVRAQLGYTCSAGVANNKMLSKLGSAYHKPNRQTVIRHCAVRSFLASVRLTKIRSLGGKFGNRVMDAFETEAIEDLLPLSAAILQARLGHDAGSWLYDAIRGTDPSEVGTRTDLRSMLSSKSFQSSIRTPEQATQWLRIFATELISRLAEDDDEEDRSEAVGQAQAQAHAQALARRPRPRTLTLHHRGGDGQTCSRRVPIPYGPQPLDVDTLVGLAERLLARIVGEDRAWPCLYLSLTIADFTSDRSGDIRRFFEGAPTADYDTAASSAERPVSEGYDGAKGPAPEAYDGSIADDATGFSAKRPDPEVYDGGSKTPAPGPHKSGKRPATGAHDDGRVYGIRRFFKQEVRADATAGTSHKQDSPTSETPQDQLASGASYSHTCPRCGLGVDPVELQSHQDWHFAKDLQQQGDEENDDGRGARAFAGAGSTTSRRPAATRKAARPAMEPGQSRLTFR